MIDLEAIEARTNAASEGPWYEEGWFTEDEDGDYVEIEPADAVFISHAREDIPALLAEVKRQAEQLSSVTAERDEARDAICRHCMDFPYSELITGSEVEATKEDGIRE